MTDGKSSHSILGDNDQHRVLVVGAGGIGCEVLKNLVLSGFTNIDIVDLDTIDLSNLNRQFLFRNEHIGRSKAEVAKESLLQFCPDASITAFHSSIASHKFGREYFKQFSVVISALDNISARNHVNRMCLAANVPLVNPGTAGYYGQVEVIRKGVTECFECHRMTEEGKTFPMCTIRNNPTRFIHCIVWAKHLFQQIFGEKDIGKNISDSEQEELIDMDGDVLFDKLFHKDIVKIIEGRDKDDAGRLPEPLQKKSPLGWEESLVNAINQSISIGEKGKKCVNVEDILEGQKIWSLEKNISEFDESLKQLKAQLMKTTGNCLVWDKDDRDSMDFVAASSNIRAHIFHLGTKSRFEIKSMAGNIVPAIATTNAIIAGQTVMEVIKIRSGKLEKCRNVYLTTYKNSRNRLLTPAKIGKPRKNCVACSEKKEMSVRLNSTLMTLETFKESVLKKTLNFIEPDMVDMNEGKIVLSSDMDGIEENLSKKLSQLIQKEAIFTVSDDLQDLEITLYVTSDQTLEEEMFTLS